jgi:cardiolipin synthase
VRITVLLQGKTDHPLLRYATQALYAAPCEAGIRIFEYEKSFMHAKVAVIDGEWATVGSSNIDPFSLLLAKEANIVVRDHAGFGNELRTSLKLAIADGARELLPRTLPASPGTPACCAGWPTAGPRHGRHRRLRPAKHWQADRKRRERR